MPARVDSLSRVERQYRRAISILHWPARIGIKPTVEAAAVKLLKVEPRLLAERPTLFVGEKCLEIGGPTIRAEPVIHLYQKCASCDNIQFSAAALEEMPGSLPSTYTVLGRRLGVQYILEGTDLKTLADGTYDVVYSSHVIEHLANPIQALNEWKRVLKPGGTLFLIVPHKRLGFDHRRPLTSIQHLVNDFDQGVDESDITHLEEIKGLHDLQMDPCSGTRQEWTSELDRNLESRVAHHHVFDERLVEKMLSRIGMQPLETEVYPTLGILAISRKCDQ